MGSLMSALMSRLLGPLGGSLRGAPQIQLRQAFLANLHVFVIFPSYDNMKLYDIGRRSACWSELADR